MSAHRVKVLIIDEDAGFQEEATAELSDHFAVYSSSTAGEGLKLCAQVRPQVVIADAGVADMAFSDLLTDLKGLDAGVLRIATSRDYSTIENVMQAIDTSHVHKYFRKPVNYFDLVDVIDARTVSYQLGRAGAAGGDSRPAYKRLHTIVDKAKDVEKLRRQLELQLAKVRDVETESFDKLRQALDETIGLRKKVTDRDAMIGVLQAQSLELEQLKRRDVDRVERERETLRLELKGAQEECERLSRENAHIVALKADNERLHADAEQSRAEVADMRVSVGRQRDAMLAEMAKEREAFQLDLARQKDDADRMVEVQKERNKTELQALYQTFEKEKQRAAKEIERLAAEAEKDRQARLAEIEASRKRVAEEMAAVDAERRRVEEELAQRRAEAERVVEAQKERNKAELDALRSAFELEKRRAGQEIAKLQAEVDAECKVRLAAVETSRKQVEVELAAAEANVRQVEADLAKKKHEAERAIEIQRERNKAEMEALQAAFKQEQERAAWFQIEQLKAELEKDRQAKLADVEAERKRGEQELIDIRAEMVGEKGRLEKSLAELREKADADIRRVQASAAEERKALTASLEVDLAAMKVAAEDDLKQLRASVTREFDKFKVAAQKKEREAAEALEQAQRGAEESRQLSEGRVRHLETDIERETAEKERAVQALATARADYEVIVRSREALKTEVIQLRESLK